ncbi:hypothetical protein AFLA_000351 [Aspergillus flavus NRRL3357]|nr:hypothetical protein AFLA_000351 [Aspergillus flavus NRRL3357]
MGLNNNLTKVVIDSFSTDLTVKPAIIINAGRSIQFVELGGSAEGPTRTKAVAVFRLFCVPFGVRAFPHPQ